MVKLSRIDNKVKNMSSTRLDRIVETLKQSKEWNECDNPETIVKREFPVYEKYSDTTIVPFLKAALIREARAKMMDVIEGVVFGGCDRKGTRLPVSWPVLLKNGKLTKVVSWNPNTIPGGLQFVKLTGTLNEDFGNYGDIELIEARPFNNLGILQKAALSIEDESVWENQKGAGDPVLVKGNVKWINPLFEKDPDGNRGSPIPVVDSGGRPVFEVVLAFDGLVELHLRFIEQNRGVPFLGIEDMDLLLADVVKIHPDDPENQAKFLQTALQDRTVVGIGEVMNISERYTRDDVRTLPVYIRLAGLVGVPKTDESPDVGDTTTTKPSSVKQTILDSGETEEEFAARITEETESTAEEPEVEESKPAIKKTKKKDQETGVSSLPDRKNAVNQIDLMVDQITEYCNLIEKSPLSIGKDELKEVGIGEGSTDMLLTVALKKVQETIVAAKTKKKAGNKEN